MQHPDATTDRRSRLIAGVLGAAALLATLGGGAQGQLLGIPVEFFLFGLMLLGVALFHKPPCTSPRRAGHYPRLPGPGHALPDRPGAGALARHAEHEWVILTNLLLLLVGFEVLSNQFEQSNLPDHLPDLLPDGWTGGLALLAIVFVLSAFLDNIAAAVIGGVMARHVYKGRVSVGFLAAIVAAPTPAARAASSATRRRPSCG